MLFELLRLIETADGPVTLTDLQRELGIDLGTLEGMIAFWVRKGRLNLAGRADAVCAASCAEASCSCGNCSGMDGCPFIARLPKIYEAAR